MRKASAALVSLAFLSSSADFAGFLVAWNADAIEDPVSPSLTGELLLPAVADDIPKQVAAGKI